MPQSNNATSGNDIVNLRYTPPARSAMKRKTQGMENSIFKILNWTGDSHVLDSPFLLRLWKFDTNTSRSYLPIKSYYDEGQARSAKLN